MNLTQNKNPDCYLHRIPERYPRHEKNIKAHAISR